MRVADYLAQYQANSLPTLGLRWSDVDLTKATVTFRRSGAATDRTKSGRVRTARLVPEVVAALKARRKAQCVDRLAIGSGWQNHDGLVFTTFEGRSLDSHNARRDFQTVLRANDLPTTRPFHSLRHGLATRLLQRDIPMHVVSAILGHSSIKLTVDVYGHVEPVMHADALQRALARPKMLYVAPRRLGGAAFQPLATESDHPREGASTGPDQYCTATWRAP
ncbi:MAG: tyrosine-type recombinase/integrase [Candidatus Nanopelagicales bacterium]